MKFRYIKFCHKKLCYDWIICFFVRVRRMINNHPINKKQSQCPFRAVATKLAHCCIFTAPVCESKLLTASMLPQPLASCIHLDALQPSSRLTLRVSHHSEHGQPLDFYIEMDACFCNNDGPRQQQEDNEGHLIYCSFYCTWFLQSRTLVQCIMAL